VRSQIPTKTPVTVLEGAAQPRTAGGGCPHAILPTTNSLP